MSLIRSLTQFPVRSLFDARYEMGERRPSG